MRFGRAATSARPFWLPYGSAAAAALVVFAARLVLDHYFYGRSFPIMYVAAGMFAALAAGRGPAIFATSLCLGITAFFLGERLYSDTANLIDVLSFAVLGPILGFV